MFRAGFPLASSQVDVQMSNKTGSPLLNGGSPLTSSQQLCEDGRPYVTDPLTGRQVCLCNLGHDSQSFSRHPADAIKPGHLPTSVPSALGFESSGFFNPLQVGGLSVRPERLPPYLGSGVMSQPLPIDPALASHYGIFCGGMDMSGGAMRKAATRETTGPLKAWLSEHKKNPYPTKAEKIMLAIITKMTLTQVSTWFANARRRLKKENKLYGSDRDDKDDDDEDDDDPHCSSEDNKSSDVSRTLAYDSDEDINVDLSDQSDSEERSDVTSDKLKQDRLSETGTPDSTTFMGSSLFSQIAKHSNNTHEFDPPKTLKRHHGADQEIFRVNSKVAKIEHCEKPKPKIWSISEIIRNDSSPSSNSSRDVKDNCRTSPPKSHSSTSSSGSFSEHFTSKSSISTAQSPTLNTTHRLNFPGFHGLSSPPPISNVVSIAGVPQISSSHLPIVSFSQHTAKHHFLPNFLPRRFPFIHSLSTSPFKNNEVIEGQSYKNKINESSRTHIFEKEEPKDYRMKSDSESERNHDVSLDCEHDKSNVSLNLKLSPKKSPSISLSSSPKSTTSEGDKPVTDLHSVISKSKSPVKLSTQSHDTLSDHEDNHSDQ